jgi:pimeloyl-ACP methyl ester carboxylesterase
MKRIIIGIALLLAVLAGVSSCLTTRLSDADMTTYFAGSKYPPQRQFYETPRRSMHYVQAGNAALPPVLFVHGSPGSWDNFKAFLKDTFLLNHYLLLAADRPGFGFSDKNGAEATLQAQAEALLPILKKQREPVVLVGHSYGGPTIVKMAIDYPKYVKALVIVAGSVSPELEPSNWYRHPLHYPPLRWVIPSFFRSSNDELLPLRTELEEMATQWKKIRCPVVIVQGKKDMLVPAGNAAYAASKLPHVRVTTIYKDDMNHFVPWSDPDLIVEGIVRATAQPQSRVPAN